MPDSSHVSTFIWNYHPFFRNSVSYHSNSGTNPKSSASFSCHFTVQSRDPMTGTEGSRKNVWNWGTKCSRPTRPFSIKSREMNTYTPSSRHVCATDNFTIIADSPGTTVNKTSNAVTYLERLPCGRYRHRHAAKTGMVRSSRPGVFEAYLIYIYI